MPCRQFMHTRHSSAIISGTSIATRSAPQMMVLTTCSAIDMPPLAISVTSSRMPALNERQMDLADGVGDVLVPSVD